MSTWKWKIGRRLSFWNRWFSRFYVGFCGCFEFHFGPFSTAKTSFEGPFLEAVQGFWIQVSEIWSHSANYIYIMLFFTYIYPSNILHSYTYILSILDPFALIYHLVLHYLLAFWIERKGFVILRNLLWAAGAALCGIVVHLLLVFPSLWLDRNYADLSCQQVFLVIDSIDTLPAGNRHGSGAWGLSRMVLEPAGPVWVKWWPAGDSTESWRRADLERRTGSFRRVHWSMPAIWANGGSRETILVWAKDC